MAIDENEKRTLTNEIFEKLYKERVHPCYDEVQKLSNRFAEDAKDYALRSIIEVDEEKKADHVRSAKDCVIKSETIDRVLQVMKSHFW